MVAIEETWKQSDEVRRPRWALVAPTGFVCLAWAACVWTAGHLDAVPIPIPHEVALFAHLGSLIVGLGAVLAMDYYGLLWLLRRYSLDQVVEFTAPLHVPVWVGLAGLVVTGVLLQPNLTAPLTWTKLIMVLVIALNGIYASVLQPRLARHGNARPSRALLVYATASALVSQVCWWGAVAIGFLNSQT